MKFLICTLPLVVPVAARWVAKQEQIILDKGLPLTASQLEDARQVGVQEPERIRTLVVPEVPMPTHPILVSLGKRVGLVGVGAAGMALRYGIYLKADCLKQKGLLRHECVHTAQYERLGSIQGFLKRYLQECLDPGYPYGALEQEAVRLALM